MTVVSSERPCSRQLASMCAALTIAAAFIWAVGAQFAFDLAFAVMTPFLLGFAVRRPQRRCYLQAYWVVLGVGAAPRASSGLPDGAMANLRSRAKAYFATIAFLAAAIVGGVAADQFMPVVGGIVFIAGATFGRFCDLWLMAIVALCLLALHEPNIAVVFTIGALIGLAGGLRLRAAPNGPAKHGEPIAGAVLESVANYGLAALTGVMIALLLGLIVGVAAFVLGTLIGSTLLATREPE